MKAHGVVVVGLMVLTACPGPGEESDSGILAPCCDEGEPGPTFDVYWDSDGLTVELSNIDTTGFDLGIAETADPDNGWFGEDCLHGTPPYNLCHVLNGSMTGTLDSVHDEIEAGGSFDLVVPNETTWFDQSFADRLTYAVTVDGGDCWIFGHDPNYYKSSPSFADCSLVP